MERLMRAWMTSRLNYQLAYVFDFVTPVVVLLLGLRGGLSWWMALTSVAEGALAFTFVEYAMHRWYFHGPTEFADGLHSGHHRHPKSPTAIPCLSSAAAPVLFWWPLSRLLGDAQAWFFLSGLLGSYFYYSLLHHLQHRIRAHALPLRILRRMWAAHGIHHARGNVNYGVTTGLWDRVLRTYQPPRAVTFVQDRPPHSRHAERPPFRSASWPLSSHPPYQSSTWRRNSLNLRSSGHRR